VVGSESDTVDWERIGDREGVLRGVNRPKGSSERDIREVVGVAKMLEAFDFGVAVKEEAKSRAADERLTGDCRDVLIVFFVGDVGDGGVWRIFCEEVALGEADASKRVRLEGFAGAISCGRSAKGTFGIGISSLWSCQDRSV
jgi:hypothetical protein